MAFIPVPATAKCELLFTYQGQPGANVLHISENSAPTAASMLEMAGAVKAAYNSRILANKVNGFTLDAVRMTDLTTVDGPQATVLDGSSGGGSTEGATPERSIIIKLLTDSRSRNARGRIYDSGYTEASFGSDGTVPTLTGTNVCGFWTSLQADLVADGMELVVASLHFNGAPRSEGVIYPVVTFGFNQIVGVQRRRIHR